MNPRRSPHPLSWLLVLALGCPHDLCAAVEWPKTRETVQVVAGQPSVEFSFAFRNTGPESVRIVRVQPNCDCVSATAVPEVVSPGDTGKIAVTFAIGGRSGRQEKIVRVFFADEPEKPVELKLVVDIPEPVAITPRFVFWRVGEAAGEKALDITVADSADKLSEVSCADEGFAVRLEATPDAHSWRVLVRPVDTARLRQAVLRLSTVVAGQPRVFVLHVAVK